MGLTLAEAWITIIGFAVIMYVILDGFDLGIGIMFPIFSKNLHRSLMLSTIIPVWDGNQTWLVFGGACMYGAFPKAFASTMPVIYFPMILMLIALVFRGVAFEFRMKAHKTRYIWDLSFFLGSSVAAFSQGVILGTYVQGFGPVAPSYQTVPHYQWLTVFSFMTGIGTMCGYVLLGCCWLIIKTTGPLQRQVYRVAQYACMAVAIFMVAFSIWTPFLSEVHFARWLSLDKIMYLSVLPAVTGFFFLVNWFSIIKRYELLPMLSAVGIFLCGAVGIVISIYPYIVPHSMTIQQAASAPHALEFMLIGACISMPVLLFFTMNSYFVFRGKVEKPIHY
jgi:cytochrome d ubiquinol oxidase subunit II